MIRARNLQKQFGDFTAVAGVDLEIRPGEVFGLLGPNGAGKSTIISMLYGVTRRTGGDLQVFGLDPSVDARKIKSRLGVVPQLNALDESLTVRENMLLYAAFTGIPAGERVKRVDELLTYMNLDHKANDRIQSLSGGMQRRLVFVRALLNQPEFLILDEPTTGLDPAVRHLLWAKVKELRAKGVTILLTTHYMHEAEILCDRIAVINGGKMLALGSPREMIAQHVPGFVAVFLRNEETEAQLTALAARDSRYQFTTDSADAYLRAPRLEDLMSLEQKPLQLRPANLEDVFLKLTGKELHANA